MDGLETSSQTEIKEVPPLPIKTYKWEDVKRARRRGGYPWTYLDKEPFDEEDEMESITKSRSSNDIEGSKNEVTIRDVTEEKMEVEKGEGLMVESADSSADISISQYLDKDDKDVTSQSGTISSEEILEVPGRSDRLSDIEEEERDKRAKSEEPRRKRKHSIESSYSRVSKYSLSRLGLMKRLKETKDKIKLPKFFSKSESKLDKKPPSKKPLPKIQEPKAPEPRKVEGPLYIHIPLKPPPGETDEFSYLEFEDQKRPTKETKEEPKQESTQPPETPTETPRPGVQFIILTAPSDDEILDDPTIPETPSESDQKFFDNKQIDEMKSMAKVVVDKYSPETTRRNISNEDGVIIEEIEDDEAKRIENDNKNVEIVKEKKIEEVKEEKKVEVVQEEEKKVEVVKGKDGEEVKSVDKKEVKMEVDEVIDVPKSEETKVTEDKDKKVKVEDKEEDKKVKVEDKKEDKEVKVEDKEEDKKVKVEEKVEEKKVVEAQVEGVKETKKKKKVKKVKKVDKADSLKTDDDKLEDKKKEEETPKPKEIKTVKIQETSNIKSDDPEEVIKTEEQVRPEEEVKTTNVEEPVVNINKPEVKMSVDEEDGLKTEITIAEIIAEDIKESDKNDKPTDQIEDLKSKPKRLSPILKKKVSFKRRSKEDSDGIYEDVQVSTPTTTPDLSQSMSVDEEKSYLDQKIIKETSLEEDYGKWSKLNDHEYEPVNPPSPSTEEPKKASTPVTDSDIEFLAAKAADIEMRTTGIITVQEQGEQSKDKAIFVPLSSVLKLDRQSSEREEKKEGEGHGHKFQEAIKTQGRNLRRQASLLGERASNQAEKIQTRVMSIKRPRMPSMNKKEKEVEAKAEQVPEKPKSPKASKPRFTIRKPNLPKLKINKPTMPKFNRPTMPKINRPNISKPNLNRLKIDKANLAKLKPKIPDQMKLNLPSFSLPRRKGNAPRRQYSTESTAGDDEDSKTNFFDFSTYPRMFHRRKRDTSDSDEIQTPRNGTDITPTSERTTLPRFNKWKGKFTKAKEVEPPAVISVVSKESERSTDTRESYRIPLHSEDSMDRESLDLRNKEDREDSVERRMALDQASNRYEEDIDMDDAYMKENQEIHRASSLNKLNERWSHGKFHEKLEPKEVKEEGKQRSFGDIHRRGVLEEINPDEFFLRQKGISQDDIEVGEYLSSEIREAFKTPNNALFQMQQDLSFSSQNLTTSDTSLPEPPKRRSMKKPQRKKTPHVSQELYDQESIHTEPESYPKYYNDQNFQQEDFQEPQRPTRKSNKNNFEDTIDDLEDQILSNEECERLENCEENMLSQPKEYYQKVMERMYENEKMAGIEQPGIVVSDPYQEAFFRASFGETPSAPPRKHRSLKSLNISEHDSITDEINGYKEIPQRNIESYRLEHEYQIPTPDEVPRRPRRFRSRTRSHSRNQQEEDEDYLSKTSTNSECIPCVEEPCRTLNCDSMGYSTINKTNRDPPLPPSAPRRKRSIKSTTSEKEKFSTVPRTLKEEPVRPLRNYSTLGPSRPPREKRSVRNLTDEEKENVNVSQYIEIEDDYHGKHLQSGEIIKKMKDRPLPAPPRPPRKSRDSSINSRTPLREISQEIELEEAEVSVQTEPLPDDFECEELIQELEDRVITPSADKEIVTSEKKPRNVNEFEHQETITHGALLIQPFEGEVEKVPMQTFEKSTERIITVRREFKDEEEDSEIPEDFKKLKSPASETEVPEDFKKLQSPVNEVNLLKASKLQVGDLDVDRLAVGELLASKITVAEIDSSSINVGEINSNSGNLVVSGIELPASFLQQLVEKLQETSREEAGKESKTTLEQCTQSSIDYPAEERIVEENIPESEEKEKSVKKKTPIEERPSESLTTEIPPNEEITSPVTEENSFVAQEIPQEHVYEILEPQEEIPETEIDLNVDDEHEYSVIEESEILENVLVKAEEAIYEPQETVELEERQVEEAKFQPQTEVTYENSIMFEIKNVEESETQEECPVPPTRTKASQLSKTKFVSLSIEEDRNETNLSDVEKQTELPQSNSIRDGETTLEPHIQRSPKPDSPIYEELKAEIPPPRPPQPSVDPDYIPSQPPASFFALRSPQSFQDFDIDDDIPLAPRRRRHHKTIQIQRDSSSEDIQPSSSRRRHRTPEPSIPQLTGQLTRACVSVADRSLRRLIQNLFNQVLGKVDKDKQDMNVIGVILLILIAGILLWGQGGKTVHHHHWEYFNPPTDI